MDQLAQQFEKACYDFQQPQTRHQAEQVLQKFQDTPQPYDFCRYILGTEQKIRVD